MLQTRLTLTGERILVRTEDPSEEYVPPTAWYRAVDDISLLAGLTRRQTALFLEMCRGHSNAEIAEFQGLSVDCVRETLLCAERKIRSAFSEEQRQHCRESNVVLRCLRNKRIQDWEVGLAPRPAQRWSAASGFTAALRLSAEDLVEDFVSFVALLLRSRLAVAAAA